MQQHKEADGEDERDSGELEEPLAKRIRGGRKKLRETEQGQASNESPVAVSKRKRWSDNSLGASKTGELKEDGDEKANGTSCGEPDGDHDHEQQQQQQEAGEFSSQVTEARMEVDQVEEASVEAILPDVVQHGDVYELTFNDRAGEHGGIEAGGLNEVVLSIAGEQMDHVQE